MNKGEATRSAILAQALDLSSKVGLEGLTIGALAKQAGMSKSGLYAHFRSKENLQCQVLDAAAARFVKVVFRPALRQPRGLPRIRALFEYWLDWDTNELIGGCPFVSAAAEFDDRPGAVHDRLVRHQRDLFRSLGKAAQLSIDKGHLRKDLDVSQFVFELWGILLSYHYFARLLRHSDARAKAREAFESLMSNARTDQPL